MSCYTFREGLPTPLARRVIDMEGMPETLTAWTRLTRKYHARWAMSCVLGYASKRKDGKDKPQWNPKDKKRDPNAMDGDYTQLGPEERERLMKTGSCFKCKKQGHRSRECPTRNKASIHKASAEETQKPLKPKGKAKAKSDEPLSYKSLLKQINACSLEERTKILEVFSND